jgi:hypothetical protein
VSPRDIVRVNIRDALVGVVTMKLFVVVAHAPILPHPTADCKPMCRVLKRF